MPTMALTIVRASNLLQRDGAFTGKSDPFVKIFQGGEQIHRTETVDDKLNPVWAEGTETVQIQRDTAVTFELWEDDTVSGHDFLGCATVDTEQLRTGGEDGAPFELKLTRRVDEKSEVILTAPGGDLGSLTIKLEVLEARPKSTEESQVNDEGVVQRPTEAKRQESLPIIDLTTDSEAEHQQPHSSCGAAHQPNKVSLYYVEQMLTTVVGPDSPKKYPLLNKLLAAYEGEERETTREEACGGEKEEEPFGKREPFLLSPVSVTDGNAESLSNTPRLGHGFQFGSAQPDDPNSATLRSTASMSITPSFRLTRRGSRRRRPSLDERLTQAKTTLLKFFRHTLLIIRGRHIKLHSAATQIQKAFRGYLVYHLYLYDRDCLLAKRACAMHFAKLSTLPIKYRLHAAATRIQLLVRRSIAKNTMTDRKLVIAVSKIQDAWRHFLWRKRGTAYTVLTARRIIETKQATKIQAVFRGHRTRCWVRQNKAALLRTHGTNFTLTERERREVRLEKEARVENRRITKAMEKKAEKELLEMIFSVADPNRNIVQWSTEETYATEYHRTQKLLGGSLGAQGSGGKSASGGKKITARNDKKATAKNGANVPLPPGGSPAEPFVPQVMILEPSERATIATEPTNKNTSVENRSKLQGVGGGVQQGCIRKNKTRGPHWSVWSAPKAIKGGARAAHNARAKEEARAASHSTTGGRDRSPARLPTLDGTCHFDLYSPARGHNTSHSTTRVSVNKPVARSMRAVRLRAELEAVKKMDKQLLLQFDETETDTMNYALREEGCPPPANIPMSPEEEGIIGLQCILRQRLAVRAAEQKAKDAVTAEGALAVQRVVRQRLAVANVQKVRQAKALEIEDPSQDPKGRWD